MERKKRAVVAEETLEIIKKGSYTNPAGKTVIVAENQQNAVLNTKLYTPEELDTLLKDKPVADKQTQFKVVNSTTLQAASEAAKAYDDVMALNFASAKNAGGGFLGGSQAQEESLARSSGLYNCQLTVPEFYSFHRKQGNLLYSDNMIYSPKVPVIRNDDGNLLDEPYLVSFITACAVNKGAVKSNQAHRLNDVLPTMQARINKMLALAAHHHHKTLVLGAWGCGVFQNEPTTIAQLFHNSLIADNSPFKHRFAKVIFAVLDNTKNGEIVGPFMEIFG